MSDLISRKALKNDLKQYFTDGVLDGVSAKLAFNQILHDIDNAPSVPLPDFKEGYKQAIIDGKTNYSGLQVECENCAFRKFSETFVDGVVDVMNKNGITSVEQLQEILKGGSK